MVKCFAKIKDLFEQLWVVIAPAFSIVGYWFERIELVVLQKIFYLFSILVLMLGVVELVKNRKLRKYDILQSKAEKTTKLALSPEKQAEDVLRTLSTYERVIKFMAEKIKKFFKVLWGNKQTIIAVITTLCSMFVLAYTNVLTELVDIPLLAENPIATKVISCIFVALLGINEIYSIVTKYGWENFGQLLIRLSNKLTKAQKTAIRSDIKENSNKLKEAKATAKKYEKDIETYKELSTIPGYTISNEKAKNYQIANANIESVKNFVASLEAEKKTLDNKLKGKE